jgi:ssDNA-binding Zn-finger/Zn-ribbon topoisomerase 1
VTLDSNFSDNWLLCERDKNSKLISLEKCRKTTGPLKLFDDRHSVVRFTRLKIDFGILPCSLLPHRDSISNEYDEIALICPVSRLFVRFKSTKEGKDKKEGGIVPFSKLSFNLNLISFSNPVILLGKGPSNLL